MVTLKHEVKRRRDPLQLFFQQDQWPQLQELVVGEVSSMVQSSQEKVVTCHMVGKNHQFLVSAASSAVGSDIRCITCSSSWSYA